MTTVEPLLNKLPGICSVEGIQYHLTGLDKVRHGVEGAKVNGARSQGRNQNSPQPTAHRVDWSRRALQDFRAIAGHIAVDSPTDAGLVIQKVVNQT